MLQRPFTQEREELGWYYAGLGPTVGLRSAGMERTGSGIYDDFASHRAHMALRKPVHRERLAKLEKVRLILSELPSRHTLEKAFTPFGAGRATYRLMAAFSTEGQPLVALALETQAVLRLWQARKKTIGASPTALLAMLEDEVSTLRRGNRIPAGHRLFGVLSEAAEICSRALVSYSERRQEIYLERESRRNAENAAFLAGHRARMGYS